MALTKAAPTTLINALASLAGGAESTITATTGDCPTGFETTAAVQVAVEVTCTWDASGNTGSTLKIWGSMDDTTYSTRPIASYSLLSTAGETDVQTFSVIHAPKYIKVSILNSDDTYAITGITVKAQAQVVS